MTFVIRMTIRELRASWRRLLFFFVCVALGVGAIVALRSVIQNVRESMVREAVGRNKPLGRVLIRDGAKVHVISSDKIDYIEAQDDYVRILAEGKSYLKNQRLTDLEGQLDGEQFLRIHRSYIVNIACVERIEQATKDSHVAILRDGGKLPVSRSGYQKIRDAVQ